MLKMRKEDQGKSGDAHEAWWRRMGRFREIVEGRLKCDSSFIFNKLVTARLTIIIYRYRGVSAEKL